MVFSNRRRDINSSSAIRILIQTPRPCRPPLVAKGLSRWPQNVKRIQEISTFRCSAPAARAPRPPQPLLRPPDWRACLSKRAPPERPEVHSIQGRYSFTQSPMTLRKFLLEDG